MKNIIQIALLVTTSTVLGGANFNNDVHTLLHLADSALLELGTTSKNVDNQDCRDATATLMSDEELGFAFTYAIESGEASTQCQSNTAVCTGGFKKWVVPFQKVCERKGGVFVPVNTRVACPASETVLKIELQMFSYPICMAPVCGLYEIVDIVQGKLREDVKSNIAVSDKCNIKAGLGDKCGLETPYSSEFIFKKGNNETVVRSCASIEDLNPKRKKQVCSQYIAKDGKFGAKWSCPNSCCQCVNKELEYTEFVVDNKVLTCGKLQKWKSNQGGVGQTCKSALKFGEFNKPSVACSDTCGSCSVAQ